MLSKDKIFCKYCKSELYKIEEIKISSHFSCLNEIKSFNITKREKYRPIKRLRHFFRVNFPQIKFFESTSLDNIYSETDITLNDCDLTLPELFFKLINIKSITFDNCTFSFDLKLLNKLPNLVNIDFKNMNVQELPLELFSISKIKYLGIDCCPIETLQPDIKKLINLKELSLVNTELSEIPAYFESFPSLDTIIIDSHKKLRKINSKLPLKVFFLRTTPLLRFSELTFIGSLEWLDLSDQGLIEFPLTFLEYFKNLKEIKLRNNHITFIPPLFAKLTLLKRVNLSHNKLKYFPPLPKSSKITFLDLSFNRIETVPDSIFDIVDLKELYLNDNSLENFPFDKIKNDMFVEVSNNTISYVDRYRGDWDDVDFFIIYD